MVEPYHVFGTAKCRDWLTEPRESAHVAATRLMARNPEKPSRVPGTCKESGAFLYTLICIPRHGEFPMSFLRYAKTLFRCRATSEKPIFERPRIGGRNSRCFPYPKIG